MIFDLTVNNALAKSGDRLTPQEKAIIHLLLYYTPAHPSQIRLSKETGISIRAVAYCMKSLKKKGIFKVVKGLQKTNTYEVDPDAILKLEVKMVKDGDGVWLDSNEFSYPHANRASKLPANRAYTANGAGPVVQNSVSSSANGASKTHNLKTHKETHKQNFSFTSVKKQEPKKDLADIPHLAPGKMGGLIDSVFKDIPDEEDPVF